MAFIKHVKRIEITLKFFFIRPYRDLIILNITFTNFFIITRLLFVNSLRDYTS